MFRFSIRELLLLTLVVAMGVGWALREGQLKAEIAEQRAMNDVWERRAEAMVGGLESCGCKVVWDDRRIRVIHFSPNAGHTWTMSIATRSQLSQSHYSIWFMLCRLGQGHGVPGENRSGE